MNIGNEWKIKRMKLLVLILGGPIEGRSPTTWAEKSYQVDRKTIKPKW